MGAELVGDFWLTLLITPGAPSCAPAKLLLRAQILTQNHTGHQLALGEELPRKRIMEAAARGKLPNIYVRCWRCGAAAPLSSWVDAAELSHFPRAEEIARHEANGAGENISWLRRCDGTAYLDQLEALASDPKEGPMPCS